MSIKDQPIPKNLEMIPGMEKFTQIFDARIKALEEKFGNMPYDLRGAVQSELKERMVVNQQSESQFGCYTGLCVETIDIWKQNRIRFFCPLFHNPKRPIKELPWASPVSAMGGFDDCGLNWVPPAGSTVVIMFENGYRGSPFYFGTTWHRDRGPVGAHKWGINIEEYYKIWEGRRKGYLVGKNDESQVFPPWNTESYNGYDLNSLVDFASNAEAQRKITYPNIYGFKTPEKHMIKMVDGDAKCNHKWKRLEIMSSCGNWFMMKDDHLHYAGQWAHPSCPPDPGGSELQCIGPGANNGGFSGGPVGGDAETVDITPKEGEKTEKLDCTGCQSNQNILGGHPSTGDERHPYYKRQTGANPFFKHENECRPYKGPETPLNPKINLPQTGIQFMSISGHTFVMDDSVEEPQGEPIWERSTKKFDFGCNNTFVGRTYWKSATGHMIELSDLEQPYLTCKGDPFPRGDGNGIRFVTATGNKIELNDETIKVSGDCGSCPPNYAGKKRGITMETTSKHRLEMIDYGNQQCSPCRTDGGTPKNKADKAYIRMRTGYNLEIFMRDANDQENTQQQFIQITAPQKTTDFGPHLMRFQEDVGGQGYIFLRAGGYYVVSTLKDKVEIIGDEEESAANKIEIISSKKLVYTKDMYINYSELSQYFIAKDKIILMAGQDCPSGGGDCTGCLGPVLVYVNGCIRLSDRVYATASRGAPGANVFMLEPLTKCPTDPGDCNSPTTDGNPSPFPSIPPRPPTETEGT